ncbi:lasso peptide biosynthesis B2 protein [Streptomyces tauricus]|uniref:lasso peptide biosynthesis B2 protein n=1 Tax=Streptomyces tauricus TaxID=68274 RepID=UPI001FE7E44B|nr:lasso peptide biosynthesis B2 protein [Streptomyces tauricus]
MTLQSGQTPPLRWRLPALLAVAIARPLSALPPRRIHAALRLARTGAAPAAAGRTLSARNAVVAVSTRCAGQGCLQRSLATALLCRMTGMWPTWCTGVRTAPFQAHAWVEAEGMPIGEPHPPGYYAPTLTVPPPHRTELVA